MIVIFYFNYGYTYDVSKASYPKEPYVSFLDHIMITSDFVENKQYFVDTVPMDLYKEVLKYMKLIYQTICLFICLFHLKLVKSNNLLRIILLYETL